MSGAGTDHGEGEATPNVAGFDGANDDRQTDTSVGRPIPQYDGPEDEEEAPEEGEADGEIVESSKEGQFTKNKAQKYSDDLHSEIQVFRINPDFRIFFLKQKIIRITNGCFFRILLLFSLYITHIS